MKILRYFVFVAALGAPQIYGEPPDTPGGVGISISETDFSLVTSVARESPAARAGILPGDRLVNVDGVSIAELGDDFAAFMKCVSGLPGSCMELIMHRNGKFFRVQMYRIDQQTLRIRQLYFPDVAIRDDRTA